jgi:predicted DNA-binding ribbon-helix-helix protein
MGRKRGRPSAKEPSARTSVSLPRPLYETLERIALQKKVSVAWVIRDAAERYVSDQWPLLEKPQ